MNEPQSNHPPFVLTVLLFLVTIFTAVGIVNATGWHQGLVLAGCVLVFFHVNSRLPRARAGRGFAFYCRRIGETIRFAFRREND